MDKEFRLNIEQASQNTLLSLKASVEQMLQTDSAIEMKGLTPTLLENIILDGDTTDWKDVTAYQYNNQSESLTVKIATNKKGLFLLIQSNDASNNSNSFDSNANDQVIVALADDRGLYKYNFQRQAQGLVLKNNESIEKPDYQAFWHEKSKGYVLEIKFVNQNIHHVGFVSMNKSSQPNVPNIITGTLDTAQDLKLLPIISQNSSFQKMINNITPNNNHFSLIDSQNRTIYQSNKLPSNQQVSEWQWLITPIYQWLFGIDENESNNKWFYRQADGMAGIKHSITSNNITYKLKSMMPQGQQSMIQTLLKAGVMMIAVVLLLMLAYLGYSLFLAWRIKKLNRAMQSVLDDTGHLRIQMPSHAARDEIGQLSRGIETMLVELREYTQYLKDLGSRLSHEIKTPLAIIQTSLDNLELEHPEQKSDFLKRAQLGSNRLKFILNQLSEVSQLKYTLENTPIEKFNLTQLCRQLGASYKIYIPQLELNILKQDVFVEGSSDLMAQLIDKIIDNAQDFTPLTGLIELKLTRDIKNVNLTIINSGSQLPSNGIKIFDSLVSVRSNNVKGNKNTHLGLGLYLVQLIARFHNSAVQCKNLKQPNRVKFSLKIKHI